MTGPSSSPPTGPQVSPATDGPAAQDGGVTVTVVVPVYNARPYLAECLDSLTAQDMPATAFEVVAVDDGSTDGSGEVLDRYAELHPHVRVIHQENSGWPGKPRNVGLAVSRGRYVFFADSDDTLGPQALRRMCEFADRHDSDVVVPKLVPLGRPGGPDYVWRRTQVDADLTRAMMTLGPWKLFRRAFLDERRLRFPEGKVRLEDGILVTEAYLTARRVSLLAGYDYYFKRSQPDGANISSSPVDPEGYTSSIARMIGIVREHCADPAVADALVVTLYRRKGLKWFGADRFGGYSRSRQEAWVAAVAGLAEQHVPARLDALLPLLQRTRSVLVRHRELQALARLATAQQVGRPLPTVLVDTWLELHVPGLVARPALVVAPGLRLVPAEEGPFSRGAVRAALVSGGQRYVWPVVRRSAIGRRGGEWAKRRLGPGRR